MTMKRFFGSGRALSAAAAAAALFALIGCSSPGGSGTETPALLSIQAETTRTGYLQGQALDLDTIRITGIYSDGTTGDIPISDAVVAGYDPARAGTQTITVTARDRSASFTVTVTDDPAEAKQVLNAALEDALIIMEDIVVSSSGDDVPQGVAWVTPAQKQTLDNAIEAALALVDSGDAGVEDIVAALEELEQAAEEAAALKEEQTGTAAEWSYTVTFDTNGGGDREIRTVANPATTVGSLPAEPGRSGHIFEGWNTKADGSGSAFTGATLVIADIAVYAQWTLIVNAQAPRISIQPQSAAYTVGQTAAALTVTAESPDGGVLSYQWHSHSEAAEEWTALEGATASSYIPPADAAGIVFYYARVTNTNTAVNGSKTAVTDSDAAELTVNYLVHAQAPVISVQPRDGAYAVGQTATALTVTAESPDGGVLSYQWHSSTGSGWTAIDGAAGSSYTPPTGAAGSISYYVKVTNTNNDVSGVKTAAANSASATVTVTAVHAQAPDISAQPQGGTYDINAAATLTVTAASPDGGVLSYQWHSSAGGAWTAIEGAAGSSYAPPTNTMGSVSYYVRVTNTNNAASGTKTAAVNSEPATVTVRVNARAPVISVQPQEAAYAINAAAAPLTVAAASPDGGTLTYQWYHYVSGTWAAIEGATGTSHTPPTNAYGSVSYYARITNTNNAVNGVKTAAANSATVTITVARVNAQVPVISAQPRSAAYLPNATALPLTVTAASPDGGVLSYQWHSRAAAATEWTAITGATAASYTPPTGAVGKIYYYVEITNTNTAIDGATGSARNSAAALINITTVGSGSLVIQVWADGSSLVSDMPEYTDISRSLGESLTLVAADDLTGLQWSINAQPYSTAPSITIEAVNYPVGNFTLSLRAEKDGVPHSFNTTFIVDR